MPVLIFAEEPGLLSIDPKEESTNEYAFRQDEIYSSGIPLLNTEPSIEYSDKADHGEGHGFVKHGWDKTELEDRVGEQHTRRRRQHPTRERVFGRDLDIGLLLDEQEREDLHQHPGKGLL